MKCQKCGKEIKEVPPLENKEPIHTYIIKTEHYQDGVIVDFRLFKICMGCWQEILLSMAEEK